MKSIDRQSGIRERVSRDHGSESHDEFIRILRSEESKDEGGHDRNYEGKEILKGGALGSDARLRGALTNPL